VGDIYDSTSYQPRKSVGYLLSRVRVEMLTALDRELEADRRLAPLELSAAQFIIIANLAGAEGPVSASDLCKGISYDAGAMTRMLDRLESKGLIRRHRSAHEHLGELYLVLGEPAKAEQQLATLEDICLIPCAETDDLKRAIAVYNTLAAR